MERDIDEAVGFTIVNGEAVPFFDGDPEDIEFCEKLHTTEVKSLSLALAKNKQK